MESLSRISLLTLDDFSLPQLLFFDKRKGSKLNVQSRAEAVSVALQRGVIRTEH
jgi:hypothetical protein